MATSVIVGVNAAMNTGNSEENGSAGAEQTAGSADHSPLHSDVRPSSPYHTCTTKDVDEWLRQNYEEAEGEVILRSALQNHYLRHCNENKLYHITNSLLGKRIRDIFPGVKANRLGKRGKSKYHYCGIRAIQAPEIYESSGDRNSVVRQQPSSQVLHRPPSGSDGSGSDIQNVEYQYEQNANHSASCDNSNSSQQHLYHQKYIGDTSGQIPELPVIEFPPENPIPEGCTVEDVVIFRSIYREHCEALLHAVVNLKFRTVESLWREFWRSQDNSNGAERDAEKCLSKTKLYLLCNSGPVQQFVRRVDCLFYQNLLGVLFPDVLRPVPRSLAQAIRNFAETLELWLTGAMRGCPEEIMHIKMSAVSALAETLRRYSSLNRLAQAARSVLENSSWTDQLLADINRVDFHSVQEQASWVFQCDGRMVQQLEAYFKNTPHQQNSLEQWAVRLNDIAVQVLRPHEGKRTFASAARQFLLNWSLYSSVVFRHLTLQRLARSDSLHLIRLLYDEYLFFLIEHKVALETGETSIAATAERYKNKLYSVSDFIEPGTHNMGVSLTTGVPVPVGTKMAPRSLVVETDEFNYHPVPPKRFKVSEQLQ
jgi:regulatory factor X 1/2/3